MGGLKSRRPLAIVALREISLKWCHRVHAQGVGRCVAAPLLIFRWEGFVVWLVLLCVGLFYTLVISVMRPFLLFYSLSLSLQYRRGGINRDPNLCLYVR